MKEYPYHKGSWQHTITEVKKYFSWDVLTTESASIIMKLYLKGTPTEQIIKGLKEKLND